MLPADLRPARRPQQSRQGVHHAVQHRHARHVQRQAALLQDVTQLGRGQREDDQARQRLDDRQHLLQLLTRADEEPDMLDRYHVLELRDGGPGDRGDRLAGRIGDQMHMEPQGGRVPARAAEPRCGAVGQPGSDSGQPVRRTAPRGSAHLSTPVGAFFDSGGRMTSAMPTSSTESSHHPCRRVAVRHWALSELSPTGMSPGGAVPSWRISGDKPGAAG